MTVPEEEAALPVQAGPRTVADLFGVPFATEVARRDLAALGEAIEEFRTASGNLPGDVEELRVVWQALRPGEPFPIDPFDGLWYGYKVEADRFQLWSAGPDPEDPEDDIRYLSRAGNRT
ncbi:MAG: hypothetical protein HY509_02165 [Acidobacteria bacterium]|nr:hypothetical protein [Acidobacteriota bacterium]